MAHSPNLVFFLVQLLSLEYASLLLAPASAESTVSLTTQPAFTRVHPCVQNCLWCGEYWLINCPGGEDGLNNILQCNNLNSLFCRTDLATSASSYLTACIYSLCTTNSIDLADGLSLYNGYCGVDGATLNNYPSASDATTAHKSTSKPLTTTTTTAAGNPPPGTITLDASPGSTPTVVVYSTVIDGSSTRATVTTNLNDASTVEPVTIHSTLTIRPTDASNSSSNGDGGGLTNANKITVVCSIVGVIFAFAALFIGEEVVAEERQIQD